MSDRRFHSEKNSAGIHPAGSLQYTNTSSDRILPKEGYDAGDGVYFPTTGTILDASKKVVRTVDAKEEQWLISTAVKGVRTAPPVFL